MVMGFFEQIGNIVDAEGRCQFEGHAGLHVAGQFAEANPNDMPGLGQLKRGGDPQFINDFFILGNEVADEVARLFTGRGQFGLLGQEIERSSGRIIGSFSLLLLQEGHLVSPDRQSRQGLEGRRVDVLADGYLELALGEVGVLWFALAHRTFLGLPSCGTTGLVGYAVWACNARVRRLLSTFAINSACNMLSLHEGLRSPQFHVTMTLSGTQHVPTRGGP